MKQPRILWRVAGAVAALCAVAPAWAGTGTLFSSSLVHNHLNRSYEAYIPQGGNAGPRPLLIVLHGSQGDAEAIRALTRYGFESIADSEGQLVVYPNGVDHNWNDGRIGSPDIAHLLKVDDVGFISSLIDEFVRAHGADPRRVYVTGMSNGAMMTYRIACELADKVAAVAPVSGPMNTGLEHCAPSRPIPLVAMNGTADQLLPWEGGNVWLGGIYIGNIYSVPQSLLRWSQLDACDPNYTVTALPDIDPNDGTRVLEVATQCTAGAEINAYVIEGGGHNWPNGEPPTSLRNGRMTRDIDGCGVIWNFVKRHTLP